MRRRHAVVAVLASGIVLIAGHPVLAQQLRMLGVSGVAGPAVTEAQKKIVSSLRALAGAMRAEGVTRANARARSASTRYSTPTLRVDDQARVQVYVSVSDAGPATLARLRQHELDVEIVNESLKLVQGWIPVDRLESLAGEAAVEKIRPPSYGRTRTGAVTSEGAAVHRCNTANGAGFVGAGAKVGVISDGVDFLSTAVASGDLPPTVQVLNPGSGFGDEGTAMLEIIADCAPGAALAFSSGFPTTLAFINSVNALAAAGSTVIVDDIGFFSEPFFQDGAVALNDRAIGNQVLRVSAAGNDRTSHYHGIFTPAGPDVQLGGSIQHDFGGGDTRLKISAPANSTFSIILQWGDPFGAAGDDYDLCVRQGGVLVGCAADVQNGNDDPIEAAGLQCTGGGDCIADIEIVLFSGAARPLKLFCLGCDLLEHNVFSNSIVGHPGVPETLAVAASPASDPTTQEPFSSEGDNLLLFPTFQVRPKPDLTGSDGVHTTRSPSSGLNPFFGTSAAAPHAAAVAALAIQSNPAYLLPLFTPMLRQALRDTAVDLGTPGRDTIFGAGRADALNAIQNELGKASCGVGASPTVVPVGQPFSITVSTTPGTGDPWDIYVLAVLLGTNPLQALSLNFASGGFGPLGVIAPARPTAPIGSSTQVFNFTAPVPAQVALFCFLVDPGFTRVAPPGFAPLSLVP